MSEINKNQFNHFKIHSQYSICEGALKIDQLKDYCKERKIKSIGLSDTSNLCGVLEFSESLSKVGTQPIIGTQIIFKYKDEFGLIPLIAKNKTGYKNLIELSSKSFLENQGLNDPHCNLDDLILHNSGLICLSEKSEKVFRMISCSLVKWISGSTAFAYCLPIFTTFSGFSGSFMACLSPISD